MATIVVSSGTQPQAGMPQVGTPMVDPQSGLAEGPWPRFFIEIWKRTGGSGVSSQNGAYLVFDSDGSISAYSTATNKLIGELLLGGGGSAEQVPVLASPLNYSAPSIGTLVWSNGSLTLTRGSTSITLAGSTGGNITLAAGDTILLSWSGPNPNVVFFPL